MFLYLLLLLGSGYAAPSNEFADVFNDEDMSLEEQKYVESFIPPGYTPLERRQINNLELLDIYKINDTLYQNLQKHMLDGNLKKGMTFNIFDEGMNAAVNALHDLIQNLQEEQLAIFQTWAEKHINPELFDYVCRLNVLYSKKSILNRLIHKEPPFLKNPHYYVNSEAIVKALKVRLGMLNEDEDVFNNIERFEEVIIINSNYSGWNLVNNGCDEEIAYFREDIGLNSYYYGLHLLHPFWMPFEKLDEINPRHAEHYYFAHQQLLARYLLEREHLDEESRPITIDCKDTFNPYLMYDNGLPFPSTRKIAHLMDTEESEIKQIDILLQECIARGVLISEPGIVRKVSESDGMNSIARFVLKNLDSFKAAKKIRDIYGGQPEYNQKYNPAPSILYNYQTALRDSVYWGIIDYAMMYFLEYKTVIPPFDVSVYNEEEIQIESIAFKGLSTHFENFQFNISKYLNGFANYPNIKQDILIRRKRLTHSNFRVSINVMSHFNKIVNVKLFLGPECYENLCWEQYNRFFQLDSFNAKLHKGLNLLTWDPESSSTFSFDDHFNLNLNNSMENRYNFFKFPNNLILPKGSEKGTNMTIFVMINSVVNEDILFDETGVPLKFYYYNKILWADDKTPLGFPFHKRAINYENGATNYNFFNVTIYHRS